jgi:hypothetical protein
MKKNLLLIGILALLLFSCRDTGTGTPDRSRRIFWAKDMQNNTYYQLEAELLAIGSYCTIWAERVRGVSAETAQRMAYAYDNDIYPKMISTFSIENFEYRGYTFSNIMQLADAFGDNDGKLCILLLDIRDDYQSSGSYVAGYFWAGNLYENIPSHPSFRYSNECDMIYVDTNPGVPGSDVSNATLAHEMQHLMNNVTSDVCRNSYPMDIWIDEGLSAAAEWVYAGGHLEDRLDWYNQNGYGENMKGLIDLGNNFFVWGNRVGNGEGESPNAILDDYATVYLFFQWLRLQTGSKDIYKEIISSTYCDHSAVTGVIDEAVPGYNYSDWETLLKTWLAANYINAPNGPYGYMNDPVLKDIKTHTVPDGTESLSLAPGEGVYSITPNEGSTPSSENNIRYAGLNKDSIIIDDSSVYPDGVLLTYNANDSNRAATEPGVTTGVAAASTRIVSGGRSVTASFTGPFRIGAADMLRRNGYEDDFSGRDKQKLIRGTSVDE